MKLLKPQLQLVKKMVVDAPSHYYLHAVTFCPRTNFRAAGHEIDNTALAEYGVLEVRLKVGLDIELPDFPYLTPIVHTLDLGQIPFPDDEDGLFEVELEVLGDNTREVGAEKKKKPKSTVGSSDAEEVGRPIGGLQLLDGRLKRICSRESSPRG